MARVRGVEMLVTKESIVGNKFTYRRRVVVQLPGGLYNIEGWIHSGNEWEAIGEYKRGSEKFISWIMEAYYSVYPKIPNMWGKAWTTIRLSLPTANPSETP